MLVILKRDDEEISLQAAQLIASAVHKKPALVLGLATGGTMVGVYKHLVGLHKQGALDFSRVVTFNLDEYLGLPSTHPRSFHHFMQENLFAHVNVGAETYAGRISHFGSAGWFIVGLLTNFSAPTFWILGGVSVALMASRERRLNFTDDFLLIRAGALILIDLLLVAWEWNPLQPPHAVVNFELLTCLAIALLLLIPIRRLPDRALVALTTFLFAGYAALLRLVPQATLESLPFPPRVFVTFDVNHPPVPQQPGIVRLPPRRGVEQGLLENNRRPTPNLGRLDHIPQECSGIGVVVITAESQSNLPSAECRVAENQCARRDSNPQPFAPKANALSD